MSIAAVVAASDDVDCDVAGVAVERGDEVKIHQISFESR